jgi:hypothetical protein
MQWGSSLDAVKAVLEGVTVEDVIEEVLQSVEVPLWAQKSPIDKWQRRLSHNYLVSKGWINDARSWCHLSLYVHWMVRGTVICPATREQLDLWRVALLDLDTPSFKALALLAGWELFSRFVTMPTDYFQNAVPQIEVANEVLRIERMACSGS